MEIQEEEEEDGGPELWEVLGVLLPLCSVGVRREENVFRICKDKLGFERRVREWEESGSELFNGSSDSLVVAKAISVRLINN